MKEVKFPILSFSKDLSGVEGFWPSRKFPKTIVEEDDKHILWAIVVDYDGGIVSRLGGIIEAKEEVGEIASDFLIVFWDKVKREVKAATGLSGNFPLFFSTSDNGVVISPAFGEIVQVGKSKMTVDFDEVMDYLATEYSIFFTHNTFVSQVKRLPPGCILTIKNDLSWKIEEGVNWNHLLQTESESLDPESFTKEIFNVLGNSIKRRKRGLASVAGITCDLSSGFDCGLVAYLLKKQGTRFKCYSHFTSMNNDDTDPDLVRKFAIKHRLEISLVDTFETCVFQNEDDVEWNSTYFFPAGHYQPIMLQYEALKTREMECPVASFTGYGGDEFFHSYDLINYIGNHHQIEFDFASLIARSGGERIFTSGGLEVLTSRERFRRKRLYSHQYGSATVGWLAFPVLWKYGSWLVNPYADLEMIRLAQRIPKMGDKIMHKQQIYRGRTEVFLPEQYRMKLPFDEQIKTFLERRKDFIVEVLERSILGEAGIIESKKLYDVATKGDLRATVGKLHMTFINLLRIEIFMQANGIGYR